MEHYYSDSFLNCYLVLTIYLILTFLFCFLAIGLFLLAFFLLWSITGLSFPFLFASLSSPLVASFCAVFTLLRNKFSKGTVSFFTFHELFCNRCWGQLSITNKKQFMKRKKRVCLLIFMFFHQIMHLYSVLVR